MTVSPTTDEEVMQAVRERLAGSKSTSSPPAARRRRIRTDWLAVLGVGLVLGGATGALLAGQDEEVEERPAENGPVIDGRLVGAIDGPSDDPELGAVAWPGQVLTAPTPIEGEAVAWQWELCDLPPKDADAEVTVETECTAVSGATDEVYESPPTAERRELRVIVTIEVDDFTQVRAASAPVMAMPWPDGLAPGSKPSSSDR